MNQGGYLLLSIVAFFLTGVGLYAADRKLTVAFRRFLHGWTSPESEPFPENKAKGLIYGRKAKQRFFVAGAISLVQTILSVYRLEFNPLLELVTLLIETPVMVLGTYLGDRVGRVFDRAQPVFDVIDRIEAGESTASGEAQELIDDIAGKFRGESGDEEEAEPPRTAQKGTSPGPDEEKPRQGPKSGESGAQMGKEEPSAAEMTEDPRALMRKYTGE